MLLTPSQQTDQQAKALKALADSRNVRLEEPCDCGTMTRHNNGGNYHDIVYFRLDAGQVFRARTWTGDYGPALDWQPVGFGATIDEIAKCAAEGWSVR